MQFAADCVRKKGFASHFLLKRQIAADAQTDFHSAALVPGAKRKGNKNK